MSNHVVLSDIVNNVVMSYWSTYTKDTRRSFGNTKKIYDEIFLLCSSEIQKILLIISYEFVDAYQGPCETCMMELFSEYFPK